MDIIDFYAAIIAAYCVKKLEDPLTVQKIRKEASGACMKVAKYAADLATRFDEAYEEARNV